MAALSASHGSPGDGWAAGTALPRVSTEGREAAPSDLDTPQEVRHATLERTFSRAHGGAREDTPAREATDARLLKLNGKWAGPSSLAHSARSPGKRSQFCIQHSPLRATAARGDHSGARAASLAEGAAIQSRDGVVSAFTPRRLREGVHPSTPLRRGRARRDAHEPSPRKRRRLGTSSPRSPMAAAAAPAPAAGPPRGSGGAPSLEDLPDDILRGVATALGHLDTARLCALQCTGRRMHGVVAGALNDVTVLDAGSNAAALSVPQLAALVRRCPRLEVLRAPTDAVCDQVLLAAAESCTRLRALHLGPVVGVRSCLFTRVLARVEHLEIAVPPAAEPRIARPTVPAVQLQARTVRTALEARQMAGAPLHSEVLRAARLLEEEDQQQHQAHTGVNARIQGRPRSLWAHRVVGQTLGERGNASPSPPLPAPLPAPQHPSASPPPETAGAPGVALRAALHWAEHSPSAGAAEAARASPPVDGVSEDLGIDAVDSIACTEVHGPLLHAPALRLRTLRVPHMLLTRDAALLLVRACPRLRILDLGTSEFETREAFCDDLLPAIASWCVLTLPLSMPPTPPHPLPSCPRMEVLVAPFARASDASMALLARNCPRLRVLYGLDCTSVGDDGLTCLADGCPSLRALSLRGASISGAAVRYMGRHCPHLSRVNLPCASGSALRHLARSCRHLTALLLDGSTGVVGADLSHVARCCSHLRLLGLRDCCRLSEHDLADLARALASRGTMVVVGGCARLTRGAVRRLSAHHANLRVTDHPH